MKGEEKEVETELEWGGERASGCQSLEAEVEKEVRRESKDKSGEQKKREGKDVGDSNFICREREVKE